MEWDAIFWATNGIAVLGWIVLIVLPRDPRLLSLVLYGAVGLLCLAYVVLLVGINSGGFDAGAAPGAAPPKLDYSIAGLQQLFASRGGLVVGWTHYLALDLFTGLWIAKDADLKRFSRLAQAPVLFLTFMLGPFGLLVWLIVRERRA